jgi:hypothetical protein
MAKQERKKKKFYVGGYLHLKRKAITLTGVSVIAVLYWLISSDLDPVSNVRSLEITVILFLITVPCNVTVSGS